MFPKVLTALWTEKNLIKKVDWLASKSLELHPILLYEEAIHKFALTPNVAQLATETLPLFHAAHFRVCQDSQCCLDPLIKTDIVRRIDLVFRVRISMMVFKYLKVPFVELEIKLQNRELNLKKINELAKLSIKVELPPPDWIGFTTLNLFSIGRPNLISRDLFKIIRNQYAEKTHP
jgi:hypothetical protein